MTTRPAALSATLVLAVGVSGIVADGRSSCLDSTLTFEASALERIVREPDRVLEGEDPFWEEEPAQQYTAAWAANNGFTISRKTWRDNLTRFAELSEASRLDSPLMQMAQAILTGRDEFLTRALPHVCAFLPDGTDTGVPVYFTAFIPPRAFVTGGIVINVDAPYWNDNADNILNTLTHEIWHVGYSHLREGRTERPLEHRQLYGIVEQLHNEGTATYVAHSARSLFPAPDELDFRMLDSPDEVIRALDEVNRLLRRIGTVSEKRMGKLSWKIGVEGRAYYIAGAHMARTIDRVNGRDALIRTVTAGPVSFVAAYNSITLANRRIEVPDAETLSLRSAEPDRRILILIGAVLVVGLTVLTLAGMRSK
jgi:hypothetical protein